MTFYPYSTNFRKVTVSPTGMNGGAVTKTTCRPPASPAGIPTPTATRAQSTARTVKASSSTAIPT